jgi:hypothetical protein
MSGIAKWLVILYGICGIGVFLYSYTQIDLGMTLTEFSVWRSIQTSFQHIGYFQRPLSTLLYSVLVLSLFLLSGITMILAGKNRLTGKEIWVITIVIACTIGLSYPAFSYDLFNYMFTAKTVVLYGKNPYTIIPLQFTGFESWLSFLQWTHLPSAYPPLWIVLTVIPYILGFDIFLLTLWNFKLLGVVSYLISVWAIGKILDSDKKNSVLGMAIFATSPIVIVEGLVSGHNDIVMMVFALLSIVFYMNKNTLLSWFLLSCSIGLKFMTIVLIPAFFLKFRRWILLPLMLAALLAIFTKREFFPWYFLWIMPFVALLSHVRFLTILATGISVGLLTRYIPFLYSGTWGPDAVTFRMWGMGIAVGISIFVGLVVERKKITENR